MRILIILSILISSTSFSDRNKKEVKKFIEHTFNVEKFDLKKINAPDSIKNQVWLDFNFEKFNEIMIKNQTIGYSYESKAPSMHFHFDYLIILDKKLKIKGTKILVYREDWGGEIGSKRWLKQFIGKSTQDSLVYSSNISAISGATISVKSMISTVNKFMKTIEFLDHKNIIK